MLAQGAELTSLQTIDRSSILFSWDARKASGGARGPDETLVTVAEQVAQFLGCSVPVTVHPSAPDHGLAFRDDLATARSDAVQVRSRAGVGGAHEFEVQLECRLATIIFAFASQVAAANVCMLRPEDIDRCIPLLQASVDLWVRHGLLSKRYNLLTGSLDTLSLGLIVLDDDLQLVFANKSARSILEDGDGLRSTGRTVTSTDLASAISLQTALAHVAAETANEGQSSASPVVAVARPSTAAPLFVAISPLCRGEGPGAVALTLFKSERDVARQIQPACQFYALSPVETRLTSALAAGRSLDEAAKELKIKDQTARSYLKQIFMKTGTNRQVDLVRMMLSLSVTTFSNRLSSLIGRNTAAFGKAAPARV